MVKTQLTWRNLLNTNEQSKHSITISIAFDQDIDENEVKLIIFNALSKYAQDLYLEDTNNQDAKPTVIEVLK